MLIRDATNQDIPAISALVLSLADHYLGGAQSDLPVWFSESLTDDQFARRLSSPEYFNRVAITGGQLAGYVCMKSSGHLYHLFVPERHQRQGVARALWESILASCERRTYTVRSSLTAVPIYERFGFTVTAPAAEKDGLWFQPMALSATACTKN